MVCGNRGGRGRIGASQRHRIQPALRKRMAPADASQRQPRPPRHTKPNQRNIGILRARRKIEALAGAEGMQHRRHDALVNPVSHADRETRFSESGLRKRRFRETGFSILHLFRAMAPSSACWSDPQAADQAAGRGLDQPPSEWSETPSQPRAPASESRDRSRCGADAESHRPAC